MDLTQMDLDALNILWQVSDANLELKAALKNELQGRIANNQNYSREYIFRVSQIQNHALGINFIPTSEAFKNYGANITVSMLLNDEELIEMGENYMAKPPIYSYGNIKATVLVKDNLTKKQIENLALDGFETSDILSILHL